MNRICAAAYTALLGLAAIAAYRTSDRDWNWDALAYMACAVSRSESDPVKIHREVYSEAKKELPAQSFKLLTESNPYRADLASDSFHFTEQVPIYDNKALYIVLIAGLHRLGASYLQAMKLLSAAGFFVLGLVFFRWARVYLGTLPAALISALFMASPPILNVARIFSPDALSAAVIVGALYLLFEMGPVPGARLYPAADAGHRNRASREIIGLALVSCAVFIRNETVILAVLVVAYLTLASRSPVKLRRVHGAILVGLLISCVLMLRDLGGGYGWRTTFYHGLVQRLPAPGETRVPSISATNYLHAVAASARSALDSSSLALFALLGAASMMLLRRDAVLRDLLLLAVSGAILLMLVYPGFEERYYVSAYVIVTIAFISAVPTCTRLRAG